MIKTFMKVYLLFIRKKKLLNDQLRPASRALFNAHLTRMQIDSNR